MLIEIAAFDVVGEITFNEKLGFLESGSDVDGMIAAGGFMLVYFATAGQMYVSSMAVQWILPLIESQSLAALPAP